MTGYPVRPPYVLLTSRGILDTFWLNLKGGLLGGGLDGRNIGVGLHRTMPQGSNLFLYYYIYICLISFNNVP